ncbi:hypothetical protein GQ597_11620 [Gilliamella sp. Pra-s65]|uniref:ERF family protein n=1 Tax=unclassified Gilliamella TaxID=2685620 RepID=UPI0013667885|nr:MULTISPECIES: ERF family protein [unclassified Gilliamella]MWN91342.1 hypothetical protein [Gilliamella sp. Pra-s65]MWP74349.1 hypothetical protein [Gilliamella sp. Pra-s52]
MSVFSKLILARKILQEKKIKQTGENKFSKFFYYELKDFLPHINLIFSEIGLCGIVSFNNELATLTIYDIDDNSNVTFSSPMSSANLKGCHPVQNIGAVETYQRRYLYMTALEIVENDVLDNSEKEETPEKSLINNNKRESLIKAVEQSAQKGIDAMGDFWKSLSIEDQKLIGSSEKRRIYDMAKEADNATANG